MVFCLSSRVVYSTESKPAPNIDSILENINKNSSKRASTEQLAPTKPPASKKTKLQKAENNIPRGQPKSGRPWKSVKQKFSTVKKSLHRRSFDKKVELRNELKHIKELSKSIKEERKEQNEAKKQRRIENAKRRLENERKAEIVQIIKNPAKIKRMRKKQLRMIEKRDLANIKVV
ncbi:unnamed protein product [Hermetia illucens]|uniref:Coiled-coil domain-containing protein 86 n=1 Tax=Hermetia illucens TaxID=343691 RepID=A0A7R8YWN4_HERIL|nr:unnamed protein product [Hermetia illucens]